MAQETMRYNSVLFPVCQQPLKDHCRSHWGGRILGNFAKSFFHKGKCCLGFKWYIPTLQWFYIKVHKWILCWVSQHLWYWEILSFYWFWSQKKKKKEKKNTVIDYIFFPLLESTSVKDKHLLGFSYLHMENSAGIRMWNDKMVRLGIPGPIPPPQKRNLAHHHTSCWIQ